MAAFDGIVLDISTNDRGFYNLISISSADIGITGRFSVCETEESLHMCMIGVILVHGGESLLCPPQCILRQWNHFAETVGNCKPVRDAHTGQHAPEFELSNTASVMFNGT